MNYSSGLCKFCNRINNPFDGQNKLEYVKRKQCKNMEYFHETCYRKFREGVDIKEYIEKNNKQ